MRDAQRDGACDGTKQRWAGCTQKGNPLPFVTAIVASNSGDFG